MSILTNWGRKLKMIAVPLALGALAACATPFNANVQRFQSALPAPQGQTFTVVADDPALAGGLEFASTPARSPTTWRTLGYTPGQQRRRRRPAGALRLRRRQGPRARALAPAWLRDPFYSPWYGYRRFG